MSAFNPENIRVVFMGTPEFAVPTLNALVTCGYDVVGVYCQPPKPAGRGHKLTPSAVQKYAESKQIPVFTPKTLRSEESQEELKSLTPDVAVVLAYGLILPQAVLDIPKMGCVNVHGSLLPRWRGAAPIHRAIEAGDPETGITIMKMDAGLDTGPMLSKASLPITGETTTVQLHDDMAQLGAQLLVDTLPGYMTGKIMPQAQPEEGVTYAHKVSKEESLIDWSAPASVIERKIRALNPWPGCYFMHGDDRLKVIAAQVVDQHGNPGQVLDEHLTVACGDQALQITKLQRMGKAPMNADDLLRGYPIPKDTVLQA